jgi:hypothetical protein
MKDCKNCYNYIFCNHYEGCIGERVCPRPEPAINYFGGDWSVWQSKERLEIRIYQDDNLICTLRSKNRLIDLNEAYQLITLADKMDLIALVDEE